MIQTKRFMWHGEGLYKYADNYDSYKRDVNSTSIEELNSQIEARREENGNIVISNVKDFMTDPFSYRSSYWSSYNDYGGR